MTKSLHEVHINIAFRNTEPTDALKQYAEDKLKASIQKFTHQDTEAHVVLCVEKNTQFAEISLHSDGTDFVAKEEGADMYSSIDAFVHSLSQQLRKHKEKLTKHH